MFCVPRVFGGLPYESALAKSKRLDANHIQKKSAFMYKQEKVVPMHPQKQGAEKPINPKNRGNRGKNLGGVMRGGERFREEHSFCGAPALPERTEEKNTLPCSRGKLE